MLILTYRIVNYVCGPAAFSTTRLTAIIAYKLSEKEYFSQNMTIIHNMPRLLLAFAIRSTTRRQETPIWLEATFQVFYNKVSWFTYPRLPSSFTVLATAPFIRPFHVPLKNILILANFDKCPFMPGAEAEKVLLLISRRISSHHKESVKSFPG